MRSRRDQLKDLYNYSDRDVNSINQDDQKTLLSNDFETEDLSKIEPGVVESGKMTADQLSSEREGGMSDGQKAKMVKGIGSALGKMFAGDPAGASRFQGLQTVKQSQPEDVLAARRAALRNLLGR